MKKRILAALLLAALMCLSLVSCGGGGDSTVTTEASGTTSTPAESGTGTPAPTEAPTDQPTEQPTEAPTEQPTETQPSVDPAAAEAKIGDTYYETFDDAIFAVDTNNVIELLKDISATAPVQPFVDGEFVIDGCGHTITADLASSAYFVFLGGKVTVKNLKMVYTETSGSSDGFGAFKVPTGCELTLENCEVTAKMNNVLYVTGAGVTTINSGTYVVAEGNSAPYSNVFDVRSGGTLIINGGEFRRDDTSIIRAMIRLDKKAHVELNDGKFFSAMGRIIFTNGNDSADSLKSFVINGGEYEVGPGNATLAADYMFNMEKNGEGVINGGTFTVTPDCVVAINNENVPAPCFLLGNANSRLTINGGTFLNNSGEMFSCKAGALTITGGSIESPMSNCFFYPSGIDNCTTEIEIDAGEISYRNAEDKAIIQGYIYSTSKVEDNGFKFVVTAQ